MKYNRDWEKRRDSVPAVLLFFLLLPQEKCGLLFRLFLRFAFDAAFDFVLFPLQSERLLR